MTAPEQHLKQAVEKLADERWKETANNIGAAIVVDTLTQLRNKYQSLAPDVVKEIFLSGFDAAQTVFRLTEKKVRTE